jgi:hypothetical protein
VVIRAEMNISFQLIYLNNKNIMRESTFTSYMNLTNKIFPIGIVFFVIVLLGMFLHNKFICEPKENEIQENFEFIANNENSIDKIKLINSAPGYELNLIRKDFLITDKQDISQIRTMLNDK